MDIFTTVLIGAVIGTLALKVIQTSSGHAVSTVVVGIFGSLLGLVTDNWIGQGGLNDFAYCVYFANVAGSILLLFIWATAQRLFLAPATVLVRE